MSEDRRTPRYLSIYLVAVLAICALFAAAAYAEDKDLLDELVKRQSSLNSVHATFVQEKLDPMLGRPIKSAGDFYFKAGNGVRWEYEDALVIYDGSVLYVYSPETNEADKIEGKQGFMGPLAFDIKELAKQFELKASRDGAAIVLKLRPKEEMPFESMEMVFEEDRAFPKTVSIVGTVGDITTIMFDDVEINKKFNDELFVFSPSPGTIVKERQFE